MLHEREIGNKPVFGKGALLDRTSSTAKRWLAVAVNWCDVQNSMRSSTVRWLVRGWSSYLFETPEHKRFTVDRRQGLIEDVDRLGGCAMDYNHSRKAGNQGDVWKHAVLTAVADAIDVG